MPYVSHFKHADDIVTHLDTIVPALTDPLLKAKYVGFVSIAAVTVYELAIKDVFVEFASKKHNVFGKFTESHFNRINGRIRLAELTGNHIAAFGDRYVKRFKKNLEKAAVAFLSIHKRDMRSAYSNVIIWRHDFAHEGQVSTTATYEEAVQSYEDGKEVIHCLATSMQR